MAGYFYQRNQRKSAVILLINMVVLSLAWYFLIRFFTQDKYGNAAIKLHFWVNIATPIVLIILAGIAIYFWINNKTFQILLTTKSLKVNDPLFGQYKWELLLDDIEEIEHQYNVHISYFVFRISYSKILVKTKSHGSFQLTQNYAYNRAKLYATLARANPSIKMPQHPYRFKQ